ncbi:ABC transporter ATP-binding protein [Saccharolobus islandicus]|uniref:ABC-type oligopeptide transport system, ATPase component n=3 Tax=Saccharolobus islandicus TaxID=43080 RepID=M9UGY8_SACIS|nr:ABC transporter ATP-binding protein [Sulfolobus islandicus]ADX83932.1 oligopeptide/dipeptide ABC transporter, ATPase subunit [Sulfolobus islandicus HVE10/4]ADX86579.1 oligopeptide/dipeptide ABC transporter, ATPase subunit [Sulfolobus islandicus REY15A]AGJ63916.1 ABC-type oligopeptide transport system, ATPase component [Sulfolobus islandicus LAL14/1]WCM37380.1 ATP-binding cassette domain-containing protein [Sulfolobus islandicus]
MGLMELKKVLVIFEDKVGLLKKRQFYALKDISLSINQGDLLIVLGESGAGKTTLGRVIVGLQKPTSGEVIYDGYNIWKNKRKIFKKYRKDVQLIPQDPYSTLPFNKTVEEILTAPILRWEKINKDELRKRLINLLELVKLTPAGEFLSKYPHQLSGGQKQRLNIARSLSVNPKIIVADEPVTMVDASLRIGILNTLAEIKNRLNLTMVFITHDIPIARYFYHLFNKGNAIVMFAGRIVESGDLEEILKDPLHPYTKDLIKLTPSIDNLYREVDVKINYERVEKGCPYKLRCPFAMDICNNEEPGLFKYSHDVACFLYGKVKESEQVH